MKRISILLLCLLMAALSFLSAAADISLPVSLTVIGEEAFAGDESITGLVEVSANVSRIQSGAFADTGMTALNLPYNVQYIEDNIVAGSPVTYIIVDNPTAELSENALSGASVIVAEPDSTASAWAEANNVEWYNSNYGYFCASEGFYYELREDGTAKLLFPVDNENIGSSVTLPVFVGYSTLTEISDYAFTACSGLESVSIPDTVATISENGVNWPSLQISRYSANPDPVLPSEQEYVEMDMPNPNISLPIGFIEWIATPEDAPDGVWMWYSSDESIVSVCDGRFVCKGLGTAAITLVIRAEDNIYVGVKNITVVEPVINIEPVNPFMFDMVVGQSTVPLYGFTTNTHLSEWELQENAKVVSGNTDIITVDENDTVTAVAPGNTYLTISTFYGDAYAETRLPVKVRENNLGLSHTTIYTYIGSQEQLTLVGELPEGASVEWSSSNTEILTVDQAGLVNILDAGTNFVNCDVTFADGSTERHECLFRTTEYIIEAEPAYDPYNLVIGESFDGSTLPLYFNINRWWFDDYEDIDVTYTSSDNSILKIENNHFTALTPGNVVVTAAYTANGNTQTIDLNFVIEDVFFELYLNPWLEGEPYYVNTLDNYGEGLDFWWDSSIFVNSYNFTSSDPEVVSVSTYGVIYPHKDGSAVITLTCQTTLGHTKSVSMEVIVENSSIALTPDDITMSPGDMVTVSADFEIPDGLYVVDDYFFVEDENIAIARNANIIAKGYGKTKLWYEVNLSDDSCIFGCADIHVVDGDAEPKVSLNVDRLSLEPYHSFQLEAIFTEEPDSYSWFSDDENFVSVDENGLVTLWDNWETGYYPSVGVIAQFGDETHIGSCPVTALPKRFMIDHVSGPVMLGEQETYRIRYCVSNSDPDLEVTLVWESSDESVFTVDQEGVITGVASGKADLILTAYDPDGNVMDRNGTGILVNRYFDEPTGISFPHDKYLLTLEHRYVDYFDTNPNVEATYGWFDEYIRFTSSDEAVFTVTDWGCIEPVAPGTAMLTVSIIGYPDLTDTAEVTVVDNLALCVDQESIEVGDVFTASITGIPEGFPVDWIDWSYDHHTFFMLENNGSSVELMCRHTDGDNRIEAELSLYDDYYPEHFSVETNLVNDENRLSEGAFILAPGDGIHIWPETNVEYDCESCVWISSNSDVITVEPDNEYAFVSAVAPGEAYVTVVFNDVNGKAISLSAHVIVKECDWTLKSIEIPDYIIQNYGYSLDIWYETDSWVDPEFTWSSSDSSVVEIREEDGFLIGIGEGSSVITLTAEKNGVVQSLSKTIHVVTTPLSMPDYVELRPGQTKQIVLESNTDKVIESVAWRSTCEAVATVDQEGNVTGVSDEGLTSVYATATFTDGTTAVAHGYVSIIRNDEIWSEVHPYGDGLELSITEQIHPRTDTLIFDVYSNAAPEEISLELFDYDEKIVRINSVEWDYTNSFDGCYRAIVEVEGLAEGETWIIARFFNDELGIDHTRSMHIRVYNPWLEICYDESVITTLTGTPMHINWWLDNSEGVGHVNYITWESSDESIVTVDYDGSLIGRAAGTATVTLKVYADDDYLWDTQDFTVHVVGAKLDQYELTLDVGESAKLTPFATDGAHIHDISWYALSPEIAAVTSDGTVLAIGPGTTHIGFLIHTEYGVSGATCKVIVPYSDEPFRLNTTYVDLLPTESFQLSYECDAGEPDSVVWSVIEDTDRLTVDQNGLVTAPFSDSMYETYTVRCTAVCGEDTYTGICTVSIGVPTVYIIEMHEHLFVGIDDEQFIPVSINVSGNIETTVEFASDDPDIAVLDTWDDGHVFVRGVSKGITRVHYIVHTSNGETYTASSDVYVDQEIPEIEEFIVLNSTIVLNAPETGPNTCRWFPYATSPDPCAYDVEFTSHDSNIVKVNSDGWMEAVAPGTTAVNVLVHGHPELCTDVPVVVLDGLSFAAVGEDNTISVAQPIQLSLNNLVDLPEDSFELRFNTHNWNDFHLTEDGLFIAYAPGQYEVFAEIFFGDHSYEIYHNINVVGDDSYFYTDAYEVTLHPEEYFEPGIRENIGLSRVVYSSDNEDAVIFDEETGMIKGVAPGVATISIIGVFEDGSTADCMNTFKVTVVDPEAPEFNIDAPKVIMVGETLPVYIYGYSAECPDHYYVSADDSILLSNGILEGWGDFSITGVAPGMTYLTCHATYGNMSSSETVAVYVVEAPAMVNATVMELRPGYGKLLSIIPADGKTIESIEWVSSSEAIATVDELGWVTGHSADLGSAIINAYITFTDGSVYSTTTRVYVTPDNECWLHLRHCDHFAELALHGPNYPSEHELAFHLGTSLAPEEISVEWSIDNTDFIAIGDAKITREDETGDTIVINVPIAALNEGSGRIDFRFFNDNLGISEYSHVDVNVYNPVFEILTDEPEFYMHTGSYRAASYYTQDNGQCGHISREVWTSSDESIIEIRENGNLYAKNPGTVNVTVSFYSGDYLWDSLEYTITVVGVSLDHSELTLAVGETAQLTPSVNDFAYIGSFGWSSGNENVARVASDGTVLAVGPGSATITYSLNDGELSSSCMVTVPYTDEEFRLSETSVELAAGLSHQLNYEGAAESVAWSSSNTDYVTVDESGLIYVNPDLGHYGEKVIIFCEGTFGEQVYSASCEVTPVPASVRLHCDDWIHVPVEERRHFGPSHTGADVVSEEITIADDTIASIGFESDGNAYVEGIEPGFTTVRYAVLTHDGYLYEKFIDVYVGDALPDIEELHLHSDTLVMSTPGTEGITDCYLPFYTVPEICQYNIYFTSSDESIVYVHEDGFAEAVGPGTASITMTIEGRDDLTTVLPVVVFESVEIKGLENDTISTWQHAQLSVDLPEGSFNVRFRTDHSHEQFILHDDGSMIVCEPGEYSVIACIDLFGAYIEVPYSFTATDKESYFCCMEKEYIIHPAEKFNPWIAWNMDVESLTYTISDENVVRCLENDEYCFEAVAPGTATITVNAVFTDGSTAEALDSFEVIVIEPEAPDFSIIAPGIIHADGMYRVYIDVHNHTTLGPNHHFVSDNESVLTVGSDDESFFINGVNPGMANLICYASYGDMESVVSIPVYVVNAPAYICTESTEIRPGQTKTLAIVPDEGYVIESIEWSSNDPGLVAVDQDGNITGISNEHGNDALITAIITFEDGSTYSTTTYVYVVHDENVWYDFYHRPENAVDLGLSGYGYPVSTDLQIHLNSNGSEDDITVEWTSSDESIVKIDETDFGFCNDPFSPLNFSGHATITAVQDGDATVTVTLTGLNGYCDSHTVNVHVETSSFEICTNQTEYTISPSQVVNLEYWFESNGHVGAITPVCWNSSDTGVVTVSESGIITGVAPGTATVTLSVFSDGVIPVDTQNYTVHVVGASFDQPLYVMEPGELLTLNPTVSDELSYKYINWYSDETSVAEVSSNGVVIANAPGTAPIRMELIDENDERVSMSTAYISVVQSDDVVSLSDSSMTLRKGQSAQLNLISETEPDSVVWDVEYDQNATIDENGLLTINTAYDFDIYMNVSCTAYFGDEAHTAYCVVTIPHETITFEYMDDYVYVCHGDETYVNNGVRISGGESYSFEFYSEDPSIAEIYVTENNSLFARGNNVGVTTVHCTLIADNGERETRSVNVYVDTPFPIAEDVIVLDEPMVIQLNEERYVQWYTMPEGVPASVSFSANSSDVVSVDSDGRIFANAVGRETVYITIGENPDFCKQFDVIVIDGMTVTGLENDTLTVATPVQLHVDGGEIWSESELEINYESFYGENQFSLTDDGLITAYETGDYHLWVHIRQHDRVYSHQYYFTVVAPEDYFYVTNNNIQLLEGMQGTFCYTEFQDPADITFELSESGVIEMLNDDDFIALAPGTTTVTLTAHYSDDVVVDCMNTVTITVLEPTLPEIHMETRNVVHVGESYDVYVGWDEAIDFVNCYCVSDDDSILYVDEYGRINAVSPGVVTLTAYAEFGSIAGTATAEMTITVLE